MPFPPSWSVRATRLNIERQQGGAEPQPMPIPRVMGLWLSRLPAGPDERFFSGPKQVPDKRAQYGGMGVGRPRPVVTVADPSNSRPAADSVSST